MLINLIKKVFQNGKENSVLAEDFNTMQDNIETAINTAAGLIAKDADVYNTTLTYKVGDLVIYNNKLYECITEITTAEAWNSAKWKETNLKAIVATNIKEIATKQKKLTPGTNITITEDGTISATAASSGTTIKTQNISGSVTSAAYTSGRGQIGTISTPSGYTYIGLLLKAATNTGSSVSAQVYAKGTTVYGEVSNAGGGEVTSTITATALFVKSS